MTRNRALGGAVLMAVIALGAIAAGSPRAPKVTVVRVTGNSFDPPVIRAKPGDTLRFVNGNGGPHNIEFFRDSISSQAVALFEKAMPGGADKLGPVGSPLFLDPGEAYVFVVPAVAPGRYPYFCRPHLAGNMKGSLFVDP